MDVHGGFGRIRICGVNALGRAWFMFQEQFWKFLYSCVLQMVAFLESVFGIWTGSIVASDAMCSMQYSSYAQWLGKPERGAHL